MQTTFNVSLDSLGTLLTAGTFGGLCAAFMSGYFIGKVGINKVLLAGAVLASFGLFGYAVAPIWVILLGVAFMTSLGKGTLDAGLNNFVSANYSSAQMNWLHACWGIGLTIAPGIATYTILNLQQGWQFGYIVMAGLMFGIVIIMAITLPNWRITDPDAEVAQDGKVKQSTGASIGETLQQPIVLISVLWFFLYGGVEIGTGQLANTLFVESRGIPQETSSAWISAYWGSFTLGRMLMGLLAIRIGDKWLLYSSMIIAILGGGMLASNLHEVTSFGGLMLLGFGLAALFPILISQTPMRVGKRYAPNTIGFEVGFAGMGGAILPGITGVIAENAGLEVISLLIFVNAIIVLILYQGMLWWEAKQPKLSTA